MRPKKLSKLVDRTMFTKMFKDWDDCGKFPSFGEWSESQGFYLDWIDDQHYLLITERPEVLTMILLKYS